MITESQVNRFAKLLKSAKLPSEIRINGVKFNFSKGHECKINNQQGELQEANLLGRSHEYKVRYNDNEINLSIQLYLNNANYYRLYCYCEKGMIFSINLSLPKYHSNGILTLKQRISITTRNLSVAQRRKNVIDTLMLCQNEDIDINDPYVLLDKYDVGENKIVNSDINIFLVNFMKITLIKGHFMTNKDYEVYQFQARYDESEEKKYFKSDDAELIGYEGKVKNKLRNHKSIERDYIFLREMKLKYKDIKSCQGCDLEPFARYNIKAINFLEFHHIAPLSTKKGEKNTITKESDIAFLCPNCHRFIHKIMTNEKNKTISLTELRNMLKLK